ncbi:MAG: HigA family addiction module antidote protein [Gammaproteobacteria bacterium]|nr:MAG: HigA family addiction module antidote protein [Gammaproteobacteria bacterium]
MRMHNPPHPEQIIRQLYLEPLGLSVTEAASALGVSRKTLSALLNGRAGISPEMANLRGLGLASSYLLSGQLRYYSSSRRPRWGCGLIRTRTLSDPAYCLGLHSGRRLFASW